VRLRELIQACIERSVRIFAFAGPLLLAINTFGQSNILKGRIRDTAIGVNCSSAQVSLLQKDSTPLQTVTSLTDGRFHFSRAIDSGEYLLKVSHPGYLLYYKRLFISDNKSYDLGTLVLKHRSDSLQAVIVTPKSLLPHIKGDTFEYNTGNIHLKANSAVEQLLARLPGLHIDPDGNITFNGEKIEKLLVDGEDVFGSSPWIVLHNFNSDMIAGVQILDKKNEQTSFTGVDDGTRNKTLNLVLKESAKKGYFGKAEIGANARETYNADGLVGSFKDRRQLVILGLASNTGNLDFNGNTTGLSTNFAVFNGASDPLGASAGEGIPRVAATALHYANSGNNNGHIDGNYQYGHLFTHPISTNLTEQILPDSLYIQSQESNSTNKQDQHLFGATYEYVPDTLSSVALSISGLNQQGNNRFGSTGSSAFNGLLVNNYQRSISSLVKNQQFNANLFWRIRARKTSKRMFSTIIGISRAENNTNGYLNSLIQNYRPGGGSLSADSTDQRKLFNTSILAFTGSINYTNPLWKNTTLALAYNTSYNSNNSLHSTYSNSDGKYQDYVDSLSSNYVARVTNQLITINLQGESPSFRYTIGENILQYNYRQADQLTGSILHYQYTDLNPHVLAVYKINTSARITFNYVSTALQPSAPQLQPVYNNIDPLHIIMGNPNLRPSVSQTVKLKIQNSKVALLNLELTYIAINNSISTKSSIDTFGRQITQPVNTNGARMASFNFSIEKSLQQLGIDFGFNTYLTYNRSVNYVNTQLSKNDNFTPGGGLSLAKYLSDKFIIRINMDLTWFFTQSSTNEAAKLHYWTQRQYGQFSLFPFHGLEISTTANYIWQQKTTALGNDLSALLWNAYASQSLWDNQLAIKFSINNILNQNVSIGRNSVSNITSEHTANILGQLWMFSIVYHFKHQGKIK